MHGWKDGEICKRMWPVPTSRAGILTLDVSNGVSSSSPRSCFFKDGRKISVGDCALFKPAQDSPPFIGIIQCSTSSKSGNSSLSVNWLYRPAEVELENGVIPEAAPNEVFYSLHSDEVPAASLIHPCKVAFLPRGVELPPGVSSFVCRRVYDISNKCLWWLTDQDFIDEWQKEVDKLLQKTRIEMHSSVHHQQGARSPKPVNGSVATSPLKHNSPDSMQNSSSNLSSQTKSKKRERGDHSIEPVKRERYVRTENGDSGLVRSESMFKLEIAKLAEKGGLVDFETVEKLVQLMQQDKSDRKIDLGGRSRLAGIIAATDEVDCLSQFVQLRGLAVLDEWLQEIHKGKIRDVGSFRDGDKSVEDFLLVLLRALDKIPVNLNALQMCNIGKSVNHLRTHKNSEIQKKARSLVDMWKKRVEAEMNINETKSGSNQAVAWPGRSRHDGLHGGNRHSTVSSDAAIRSSVTHHSSLKSSSVKLVQGDSTSKSVSVYPGGVKSTLSPVAAANCKDGQSRILANAVSSETPQAVARDDKSSSSSQSHTDSQCSSDHVKSIVPSGKEDARSSTSGSRGSNKISGSGSKHRKSANGLQGAAASGLHRETTLNRGSTTARISAAEKVSDNVNSIDSSAQEGNNHKLIVKIPNRGRGAVQSIIGGSLEDSSCRNSRASSPAFSEKHDQVEAPVREKSDPSQSNEVDGASTSAPHKTSNDPRRLHNVTKVAYSPSRNELKPRKVSDSSFSSMNALVESCVKFSEVNVPMSAGDDVGMNLLASVATGEISHSGAVSPAISPHRTSAAAENSCSNHNTSQSGDLTQQPQQLTKIADADKHNIVPGVSIVNDGEPVKWSGSSSEIQNQNEEGWSKSNGKLDKQVPLASVPPSPVTTGKTEGEVGVLNGQSAIVKDDSQNNSSQGVVLSLAAEEKVKDACLKEESDNRAPRDILVPPSLNVDKKHDVLSSNSLVQHSHAMVLQSESANNDKRAAVSSSPGQEVAAEKQGVVKSEKVDCKDLRDHDVLEENRSEQDNHPSILDNQEECGLPSDDTICKDENVDKETLVQSAPSATQITSAVVQQIEVCSIAKASDTTAGEGDRTEDSECPADKAAVSPPAAGSDIDRKLGFDLNEGFSMDEVKNGEAFYSGLSPYPASISSVSPLQFSVSSASGSFPASITVAAAAKGSFVPPDDLLKNKRELGWKGSAATSAFRPAEPRKSMEVPQVSSRTPLSDAPAGKQSRPFLDFDLNVADERTLLDMVCQTSVQESNTKNNLTREFSCRGLNLDLNKADEARDIVQHSASSTPRLDLSSPLVKPLRSSIFPNGETSGGRDFDLNDGPAADEMPVEQTSYNQSQHGRNSIPLQVPPFGPRINSSDTGNCFAWYPPGPSYSVSMTPAVLHDRESFPIVGLGSGAQRVMGGPTPNLSFNPDTYRGSVLSSTPAMPFHSAPFQYPVFPFGTSFPLSGPTLSGGSSGFMDPTAGGRIPSIPSQFVGTAAAVPFQYPHAYVVSRPIADVGNNGVVESNQKWGKQGLDLNSGPGGVDLEGRDESGPTISRPFTAIGSQSLVEEQARMLNMPGGVLKRKEPDTGWSMDKLNFKQSSWR